MDEKPGTTFRRVRTRLVSFWKASGLTFRVLVACLFLVVVPVTASLVAYSMLSVSTMEREIRRNMQISVEQSKNNMDYRMGQVEESSMAILTSAYPFLNSNATREEQFNEYYEMTRIFSEYVGKHMITKLRLYVPAGKVYSHQSDTFYSLADLGKEGLESTRSGTYWLETHDITLSFGENPIPAITCETAVSSSTQYDQVVGVLFLDIGIHQLDSMLTSGIREGEALFLVDGHGILLAHSDEKKIGQKAFPDDAVPDFANAPSGNATIRIDGEDTLVAYAKLETTDWYMVMTVPRNQVFSAGLLSLDIFRLAMIFVIVFSILLSLVLIYRLVVRSTFVRINKAISGLESQGLESSDRLKETAGNVAHRNRPSSLVTLETNSNRMISTIHTLLERQYKNQRDAHQYHMQALQAQINPHFLYNTLDVIKWMIIDDDKDDSVWMVNALSKYFQLSISKGRDIVRIREEISLTKTYVGIMQKRFKNVFTVEFHEEPDMEDCLIPKLSLQPLVENALIHGILYCDKPDRILVVRVSREDGKVLVSVEDNGVGIDEEKLQSLRAGTLTGKSYGLSNVKARLELFGADEDGFEITSRKDVGTCVTLRFPIRLAEPTPE